MDRLSYQRLPNGLPVLSVAMPGTESAAILVSVKIGSRYEKVDEQGVSHVLEHMLFKGSQRWPTAKDLSQTLDSVGADYNAFTAKDQTGYYIRVARKHLPLATEVLADMVCHPLLDKSELAREKKVICEEIKMYEDNPLMHIGDLLEGSVFAGSSLGVNIAGSLKSVTNLSQRQVKSYHEKYYGAKNLLVALAGNLTSQDIKLVAKKFGGILPGNKRSFTEFKFSQMRPSVVIQKKETQQVQLALGFPAYGYRHKNVLALDLLAMVLGGNMSSRLFMRLREREGLCYAISSAAEQYEGTGVLAVQAGLDKARLPQAIKLIKEELLKVTSELVSPEELAKVKEYIKGKMTLAMENSAVRAQWAAKHFLFERERLGLKEFLAKIEQVKAREVMRAASEVINFKRANLALIGPFKESRGWLKLIKS